MIFCLICILSGYFVLYFVSSVKLPWETFKKVDPSSKIPVVKILVKVFVWRHVGKSADSGLGLACLHDLTPSGQLKGFKEEFIKQILP